MLYAVMPLSQPSKPKLEEVPFNLFPTAQSPFHSPRSGLLALSRVYRSLGLPELAGKNLHFEEPISGGSGGSLEQTETHIGKQRFTSNLVESLILLQAAGADCVRDRDLLAEHCLRKGLGFTPPSLGQAEKFLQRLAQSPLHPNGVSKVHKIMSHLVDKIWHSSGVYHGVNRSFALAKQITIDVLTLQGTGSSHRSPHVDWSAMANPDPFPCRVLCVWRETDLVLGGGDCPDVNALIRHIDEALKAIPNSTGKGRLVRAGSVCFNSSVLDWIGNQANAYRIKVGHWKTRHTPVGFIVAVPVTSKSLLALDQGRDGWATQGIQPTFKISWKKHMPENRLTLAKKVRYIAFRQSQRSPIDEQYIYAMAVTNRDRSEGYMINWYLRDARNVNQVVHDLEMLASGSNQGVLSESTGEGRFQLAMITYNLLTAIRFWGFPNGSENISVSRLRELLVHTTGRIVKGRGEFNLKLSQAKALKIFLRLREQYPVDEKARTPRKKTQHKLHARTTVMSDAGA